jgi:hypothetical protein
MNNNTTTILLVVGVAAVGFYLYQQQQKKRQPANPNARNPELPLVTNRQPSTPADYINAGANAINTGVEVLSRLRRERGDF